MLKFINNTFLIMWPLFITILIIPIGIINLFKIVIIPSIFSNNFTNPENNIYRNNVNWGVTQILPEPDIIINDNSVVVEAKLFPDIDKVKEEYNIENKKLCDENKKLCDENKKLCDENIKLQEIINQFEKKINYNLKSSN